MVKVNLLEKTIHNLISELFYKNELAKNYFQIFLKNLSKQISKISSSLVSDVLIFSFVFFFNTNFVMRLN